MRTAEERRDFEDSYRQKSATYFEERLPSCQTVTELDALINKAELALDAWKRTPLRPGNLPVWGTPECDEFIRRNPRGLSQRDLGDLWGKSLVAIGNIQRQGKLAA